MSKSLRPVALRLDRKDNVAVVLEPIEVGRVVVVEGLSVIAIDRIPAGHKVALSEITREAPVMKYGEPIGKATLNIPVGAHVHVHNTVSLRLPGPDAGSPG